MSTSPTPTLNPQEALTTFFRTHTPQTTEEKLMHLFKAHTCQPENKKHYPDQDIALFLDQLTALVAAAHQLHQSNRAPNHQEGTSHD